MNFSREKRQILKAVDVKVWYSPMNQTTQQKQQQQVAKIGQLMWW